MGDEALAEEPLVLEAEYDSKFVEALALHFHFSGKDPTRVEWVFEFTRAPGAVSSQGQQLAGLLGGVGGAAVHVAEFVGQPTVKAQVECTYVLNERKVRCRIPAPKRRKVGHLNLLPDSVTYVVQRSRGQVEEVCFDYYEGDPGPFITGSGSAEVTLGRNLLSEVDDLVWNDVAALVEKKK